MIDSILAGLRDVKGRAARRPALNGLRDLRRRVVRRAEGESILMERFARAHGRPLDLANPQTFTEKLFCRMVQWNRGMDPRFTQLADKLAVRPYVMGKVGAGHLVTVLWHGIDARDIPFDRLRPSYVIKTNHASGQVVVVKEMLDRGDVVRRVSEWLASNYYWSYREYQYFRIPPRVMVEEHLANADGREAFVYRFWCFGGVPRVVSVGNASRSINPFYDMEWNYLELQPSSKNLAQPRLERPENFDRMIAVAARLSEDLDFVRVDLYNVDGKTYFSELTFTPAAGFFTFRPIEWDLTLGQMWTMRNARS